MAMDFERMADAIIEGLTTDPDDQYPPGAAIPLDGPELAAFCYYLSKAIVDEITTHGEVNTDTGDIS